MSPGIETIDPAAHEPRVEEKESEAGSEEQGEEKEENQSDILMLKAVFKGLENQIGPAAASLQIEKTVENVATQLHVEQELVRLVLYDASILEKGTAMRFQQNSSSENPQGTESHTNELTPELRQAIIDLLLEEFDAFLSKERKEERRRSARNNAERISDIFSEPYGGREHVSKLAFDRAGEEEKLPPDVLRELVADPDKFLEDDALLQGKDPVAVLFTIWRHAEDSERSLRMSQLEVEGMSDIHELIASLNVSGEQKEQWTRLLSLDIPRTTRVKVLRVWGSKSLDMQNELPHLEKALKSRGFMHEPVVVEIDNTQLSKEDIFRRLEEEMKKGDFDIVIPYFSMHGDTMANLSADAPESITSNDPKDVGLVLNEGPQDPALVARATAIVDAILKRHPEIDERAQPVQPGAARFSEVVQGNPDVTANPAPSFKVDIMGTTYTISGGIGRDSLQTIVEVILGRKDRSITSDEILALQSKCLTGNQEAVYIFDSCYSGSMTDDALAKDPRTRAVLAGTAEDIVGYNLGDREAKGAYMDALFTFWGQGYSLGEAFVRADISLHIGGKGNPALPQSDFNSWQNPRASYREQNGGVLRVSSIEEDLRRNGRAGELIVQQELA